MDGSYAGGSMSFIGRAEEQVSTILYQLLEPEMIRSQALLINFVDVAEYMSLDEEIQQHKFDLVVYRKNKPNVIVEINYKHKEKAAKKWRTIFDPMLKRYGHETLVIHDYECLSLFKPQDYSKHISSEQDIRDVINAIQVSKITL